jgi:hypothetical protein
LLLIDAAVETSLSMSPVRWWVVGPIALYLLATLWLLAERQPFGRSPGWVTLPVTPPLVGLGLLTATASMPAGMLRGMTMLGQPTPVLLSGATLASVLLAGFSLARPTGAPWWWRLLVLVAAGYAVAGFVFAIKGAVPYPELLRGRGFPLRLPFWLQGAFIGGLVMVPAALVWEIGTALARLVLRGRRAVILALALGLGIALLGFTV